MFVMMVGVFTFYKAYKSIFTNSHCSLIIHKYNLKISQKMLCTIVYDDRIKIKAYTEKYLTFHI